MSSFTIENLLRQSDETPRSSGCTINSKRPAIRLVSKRHGHLFNIPCCQTTALCAEPDKRRNRSVCNQISVGKGKSAFTVIPLSQERWYPCSSISNFAAYDIIEHNSRLAKLYNTNLRNSLALNPQANSTERNDANNEISLDLQIHPIATDNKDDVRMRHEKINIKYDWMVNPRPFYRKGNLAFAIVYMSLDVNGQNI